MSNIYLGLGTNIGNRTQNIDQALNRLTSQIKIKAISPIYETAAWGIEEQPDFLNLCLVGETMLSPRDLLHFVKNLEVILGREKTIRWGPRLIDIDILFIDDLVLGESGLSIPHEGIANRAFVLMPLADIAPDFVHPVTGKTVAEMLAGIDTQSVWPFNNNDLPQ